MVSNDLRITGPTGRSRRADSEYHTEARRQDSRDTLKGKSEANSSRLEVKAQQGRGAPAPGAKDGGAERPPADPELCRAGTPQQTGPSWLRNRPRNREICPPAQNRPVTQFLVYYINVNMGGKMTELLEGNIKEKSS